MFKYKENGEFVKPKMKTTQKLHTTISMLALTVIALTTATYAWFTLAASTRVNSLDLEVSAGAKLKIATNDLGNDVDDYYDEVLGDNGDNVDNDIDQWLRASKYRIGLHDILLSPQTSNDGENFYIENGSKTNNPNLSAGSYMEYELWLIAENDMRVHLSTNDDGDDIWTHIDATPSELGNSSAQENIVNCVRMAFFCEDDDRTLIWAPNDGHRDTSVSFGSTPVTGLYARNDMEFGEDTWICELNASEAKKITVRVWVEGNDPDCEDDVQKAKFRTWLHFQGTDSDNNPIS